jgi:hypothetical protein
MKMERKIIDTERNIVQCTYEDERWYLVEGVYLPSVTWICDFYPKSIGFYKWLANKGWNEAEGLKEAAGNKGSKIHQAINKLLTGGTIAHNETLLNHDTGRNEEITVEEYEAVISFAAWFKATKPKSLEMEKTVYHPEKLYAGTMDYLCEIAGEKWLIDFKSSQNIYSSHHVQVSAYKKCIEAEHPDCKLGILQIGYCRNKNKYKFNEIADCYDLFLASYKIWQSECAGIKPLQKDFPLTLTLEA